MSDFEDEKKDVHECYEYLIPTKLTEGRRIKLKAECWGILSDYYLESVKIDRNNAGVVSSIATLRVTDRAGQITCLIRGPSIGLLFGLTAEDWIEVENMCNRGQQLFYRYFKNGISWNFNYEQKLFYNFCVTNQKNNILAVKFQRCSNKRNKFKNDAFLDVLEVKPCDSHLLDLYVNQLQRTLS